jgi:predicted transposase YdaD
VEAEMVFDQNLLSLMPFVPILKGGDDEDVVRQAVQVLQQDPRFSELESLLAFFASFVLDTEVVAQILRWDMTVLRESPWYQEILQQGLRDGLREGENLGLERERALILRLLTQQFSNLPASLLAEIEQLPLERLEELSLALRNLKGIPELEDWLRQV